MIDTVRKNRRSSAIARDEYPRDRTTALAKGVGKRTEQALLDTLRRTELQIQAIGQISLAEEILSGDVEGLARRITELAAGVVGCERVNVWLFDANETVLRCIDLYEATSARHSAGMLLREDEYRNEFYALKHLKCVNADDPLTDPRTAGYVETYLKPLRITSMLDAVIKLSGMSLGILCFEHVDKPHHWEQDEISFASQLADKLALALMSRMRIRAEVELRASEARFRALVEQAPEAILVYDVDRGHVIDANRQAEALFACCRDELLKSGPQRFYVSEQPDGRVVSESFADHNRRALAGESVVFERQIHNANEEDLVCEVRLARLPSGESDGRLLRASFIDTTQRKHAEEKLRLANTLLASEIESAPDGVLVVETERGLASFNRKCLEMWKIPPDVARRRDPDAFLTTILEQIADPEDFRAEVLRFREDPDMPIHRDLRLKDGRTFECHTGALRQAPGDSVGRISFFRDITDRKRAEAQLRESEERFRTIFASVNDAIMVNDADTGTILDVNQRMCEMFGYTRGELLELDVADLSAGVAPYTLRDAAPVLKRAAAGEAVVFEWFCRAKNGRRFWIEISLRRAAFGGHDVLLSTARDVTERRRAAEALTYRDRILHAMTLSAAAVVAGPSLALSMPRALKIAGEALQVDRMLVLERLPSPIAAAPVSLSCGWQKAGVPHLEPGYLAQFPAASKEVVEWLAPLSEGKPVITYGDTATGAVGQIMREMKNRSNLLVPISVAGEWWGHIGIDDCKAVRHWTSVEIDTLGTLAEVIGAVITRERTQASLQKSEERFRAVSETAQDAVIMLDEAGTVLYWNRSAQRILGHTVDEAIGRSVQELLAPPPHHDKAIASLAEFARTGGGNTVEATQELLAVRKDGVEIPIELSVSRMQLGKEWHAVAILRDITKRKRAEENVLRMARFDSLTGLANRSVCVEALQHAIARTRRGDKGFAVLYLDLDHFKDVNDTLGHPIGDLLLQAVAERLRLSVRETDIAARFGGDEFALIQTDLQEPEEAAILADKVLKAISEPFSIQGNEIRTGTSCGIAVYGADSPDAESLLSHADMALYRAKSEGRGTYRFFTESMDIEVRKRVTLGAELREAIAAEQLFLVYQPQVDSNTGRIVGLEALVRWRHPTLGLLPPAEFVPVAEKSGLIVALGYWVMREACRQTKIWLDAGILLPLIAVNVSGLQLKTALELETAIAAILTETGLPPEILELELTETVLMDASRTNNDLLLRLRNAGLRIAIDDFGTGYSSLDYLRRFPVDRIKIAQNFISELTTAPSNAVIVKAAIGLARELDIDVVAEGVETDQQLALIESWGCHTVQGYYFSKPLPAEETTAILRGGAFRKKACAKS